MKSLIAVCAGAVLSFGLISPSFATSSLVCESADDGDVELILTLGSLPVLAIVGGRIHTPNGDYAFIPEAGEIEIITGQAFVDNTELKADFTDPNIERVLVSLRLARGEGDKQLAEAGVLIVEQSEVYPVFCFEG